LCYEEKEDGNKMFYTWCEAAKKKNRFTYGCKWLKHDALIQHTNTQDHRKSKPILHNQTTIEYRFKCAISKNKLDIIRIMQYQFNEAENEALFGPFVGLKKVQSIIDPPNTICSEYSSYDNDVSAYEFLEAISFVIEESLSNEIQNSPYWSIQIDDNNTIKQEKMLAIVSKHLSNNYSVIRFLGIIQLDNAAAQPTVNNINHFLTAKKLNISNIFHIGSDGASTMIRKKNGVAAIFKKQNPFLLEYHCIAHRLALTAKDATEKVPYFENYNSIINNLYSYFSSSYKQIINLRLIEQIFDDPNLVLLQIINTRWLSLSNVVSNLHQILKSVKTVLNEDSSKNIITQRLYNAMDQTFYLATKVYTYLNTTINTITTQYIGRNRILLNYGNFLREYINEQNILFEDLSDFILQFAIATIESLQDRFLDSEMLNSLRIFDPHELPPQYNQIHSYSNSEIQTLAKFYGKPKKLNQIEYLALIDDNLLTKKWDIFKYRLLNYFTITTIYIWKALFDLSNFSIQFPNIKKLVSIFLVTPLFNAIVERVFS
ncbi:1171_t:CDS:2, partial [Scutellospora calospora]